MTATIKPDRASFIAKSIALAAVACALSSHSAVPRAAGAAHAASATTPLQAAAPADLENVFWICDYRMTVNGDTDLDVIVCSTAFESLKARRFAGDFATMLQWWRDRRAAEHGRLRALDTAAGSTP